MSKQQTECCSTCKFFKSTGYDGRGDCLRYPPGAIVSQDQTDTARFSSRWRWAVVNEHEWCGEWRVTTLGGPLDD